VTSRSSSSSRAYSRSIGGYRLYTDNGIARQYTDVIDKTTGKQKLSLPGAYGRGDKGDMSLPEIPILNKIRGFG